MNESDLYIASGLLASSGAWTFRSLAEHLRVAVPLVQRSLKRLGEAGLYDSGARRLHAPNFEEFAVHGLRFVAPVRLGPVVSGVPAAWAAPPMRGRISDLDALPPVWPHPLGSVRGHEFRPLHNGAVEAVQWFSRLGEILAVIDSLRFSDRRVHTVAAELLGEILREYASGRE